MRIRRRRRRRRPHARHVHPSGTAHVTVSAQQVVAGRTELGRRPSGVTTATRRCCAAAYVHPPAPPTSLPPSLPPSLAPSATTGRTATPHGPSTTARSARAPRAPRGCRLRWRPTRPTRRSSVATKVRGGGSKRACVRACGRGRGAPAWPLETTVTASAVCLPDQNREPTANATTTQACATGRAASASALRTTTASRASAPPASTTATATVSTQAALPAARDPPFPPLLALAPPCAHANLLPPQAAHPPPPPPTTRASGRHLLHAEAAGGRGQQDLRQAVGRHEARGLRVRPWLPRAGLLAPGQCTRAARRAHPQTPAVLRARCSVRGAPCAVLRALRMHCHVILRNLDADRRPPLVFAANSLHHPSPLPSPPLAGVPVGTGRAPRRR